MPDLTDTTLPVLPLPAGVVIPGMVVNLAAETEEAKEAVAAAGHAGGRLLLVPQVGSRHAAVGTVATIEHDEPLPSGGRGVVVRGLSRAKIGAGQAGEGGVLWVSVEDVVDPTEVTPEVTELMREYRAVVAEILEHRNARGVAEAIAGMTDPGQLADTAVYSPDLDAEQRIELLETLDVRARLEKALAWAKDSLAEMSIRDRVRSQVTDGMERDQREHLLRRQLEAIRTELGDADGDDPVAEYRRRLAEADLPEPVQAAVTKEIDRLERMGEQNPEHGWVRTWLDTIFELPWGVRTDDEFDLRAARAVLDADHSGLDEVKERLVEFLAVRKLRRERTAEAGDQSAHVPAGAAEAPATTATERGDGAILALVGPPGVGKTSLGESVARALGRRFVRVALGGVRDEAEIRGHRRTYVGAQPGRIARALREAGSLNPVVLLDELDKVGADWRGDPTSALLEVLDPAQNHTFRDHYLEVDLDLSDVLFLATANVADTIPPALYDRLEIIRLDGYTEREKAAIARAHLLPRQLERAGLRPDELDVSDEAIAAIVDGWTREAGVRGLERQLGKLARKAATRIATGAATPPITVDTDALRELLGRPTAQRDEVDREPVPGIATGLAVTGAGGDVLAVEANAADGEPGLTLTGQLGDVMRESAEIALSWVRAHLTDLGVPAEAVTGRRFHVHVPAGAIPKDGPSAGITMVTALASLVSGRAVRPDVGMTGEVTLTGRVLPIGGVKQKVLAAHRAGLREVILPQRNEDDLDDVPAEIRDDLTFHFAERIGEVLSAALEEPAPVTS
ncbi:MAG: endopeptidase La [Egibacteraceae bacterium]